MAKKKVKVKYKFHDFSKVDRPVTSEFWYDIADGGYIVAESFSSDPTTVKAINEAIKLLKECEENCETF